MMPEQATATKQVDSDGRLTIPKEARQAIGIEGEAALVELTVEKVRVIDDE